MGHVFGQHVEGGVSVISIVMHQLNEDIRDKEVRLIGSGGEQLGTTFVALIFSVTSATDSMPICMYVAVGFALVAAIVSCLRISQPVPMRGR